MLSHGSEGISDNSLAKEVPNLERLVQLIDIYNDGPSFGNYFDPIRETAADMYGLLIHFLTHLPYPIIPEVFFHPLWYWCVKPTVSRAIAKRKQQEAAEYDLRDGKLAEGIIVRREDFTYRQKALEWTEEERHLNAEWEGRQVEVAAYLMRMLPVADLSLFAYLMDLFITLCENRKNKLTFQGVARHFGQSCVGGMSTADARRTMEWLLERWEIISDRVFAESRKKYEEKLNPESRIDLLAAAEEVQQRPSMDQESFPNNLMPSPSKKSVSPAVDAVPGDSGQTGSQGKCPVPLLGSAAQISGPLMDNRRVSEATTTVVGVPESLNVQMQAQLQVQTQMMDLMQESKEMRREISELRARNKGGVEEQRESTVKKLFGMKK